MLVEVKHEIQSVGGSNFSRGDVIDIEPARGEQMIRDGSAIPAVLRYNHRRRAFEVVRQVPEEEPPRPEPPPPEPQRMVHSTEKSMVHTAPKIESAPALRAAMALCYGE